MSTGKSSNRNNNDWVHFKTFKQRGEWVELQLMAQAARRRFAITRPWGETRSYDVGIEHGANFLRVQVKSTTYRVGAGYLCQFKPNHKNKLDYSLKGNRPVRHLRDSRRCVVPDPSSLTAGQAQTRHGHAVPLIPTGKEGQLLLRMLPRSLEPADQEPHRAGEARTLRSNATRVQ
jgi:hypothetical protein